MTMPFRTKDTLLGQARSGNPYNLGKLLVYKEANKV